MTRSRSLKKNKLAVLLLILGLLLIIYFAASGINRYIENSENEDTWVYKDNTDFPLDQSLVETVADDFASMSGTRRLSDPDDGEDYGFAEPSYEVSLTEEDGSTLTVKVGNTTGEEYYITADDGSTVFTAEGTAPDDLVFDEDALIECEDFPSVSSDNLKKITITKGSSSKSYNSKNDEEDCEEYGTELSSIAFTDCVTYDMDSDEYVYMQLKGSSMVYKVSTYSLEKLV